MIRSNTVVVASLFLLVLVTGCNNQEAEQNIVSTPMAVKKKVPKPNPTAATLAGKPKAKEGKAEPAATPTAAKKAQPLKATTSPAKAAPTTTITYAKEKLGELAGYLPAAVKALEANDVDQAKEYAKDFSDNWNQKVIQDSVKTKAPASHQKIAAAVTQVNTVMKAAKPDKAKAIAALQSLSQAVDEYTKSP
jgi:hypothetical protein